MKKSFILIFLSIAFSNCATTTKVEKSTELLPWNSEESITRFERSQAKKDFFVLSNFFETQENGIVCGLASSTVVLNALQFHSGKTLPVDKYSINKEEARYIEKNYDPYLKKYTPNNVLNSQTKKKIEVLGQPRLINGEKKKDFGLQLEQLAQILRSNGAQVKKVVVDDKLDLAAAKNEIIENLKNNKNFVLVNYARKSLGQNGGGHISPLGAYDLSSDSFLVMDVNPNNASWVWVPSEKLFAAMNTFDTLENRGFLIIE